MCFFENDRSKRNAKIASFTLREMVRSDVKKKFFATCCVMVDAPENLASNPIARIRLFDAARKIPWTSIPGCVQKFWSSAAINAFTNCGGISSKSINTRRSSAYSINSEPSAAYRRVATGGAYVANFL